MSVDALRGFALLGTSGGCWSSSPGTTASTETQGSTADGYTASPSCHGGIKKTAHTTYLVINASWPASARDTPSEAPATATVSTGS